MKLFTIFNNDARALEHLRPATADRIARLLKRVGGHHEWGVRVVVDPAYRAPVRSDGGPPAWAAGHAVASAYLALKKAQRDPASGAGPAVLERRSRMFTIDCRLVHRRPRRRAATGGPPGRTAAARCRISGAALARGSSRALGRTAKRLASARIRHWCERTLAAVLLHQD